MTNNNRQTQRTKNQEISLVCQAKSALAWPAHMKVFCADSDAMDPFIKRNDFVVVDTTQNDIREAVYALQLGDLVVIRRVQPLTSGKIRIICDNKHYQMDEVSAELVNIEAVIGRAVMVERHLY